jgi:hypothetical protein
MPFPEFASRSEFGAIGLVEDIAVSQDIIGRVAKEGQMEP